MKYKQTKAKKPDHPIKGFFSIEGPFLFCTYYVICSAHLTLFDNYLFVMNPGGLNL